MIASNRDAFPDMVDPAPGEQAATAPVPRRFTAPRLSHASNEVIAAADLSWRSARNPNFITGAPKSPSVTQRQIVALSGAKPAARSACSRRAVFSAPQAISRST